jgi:tetratricopeptide (TPR) repeat protein
MQIGDAEHAHYVLVKNPSIKSDPWLIASEIAINSSMKRYSRFINIGKSLIQSQNYSTYSCSELASAIGTLEMSSGNRKLCTKFMNHALLQPNDNSLAQAEWLSSQNKDLRLKYHDYSSLILKAEADARFAYAKREFAKSYNYSIHWLDDYPYDKGAIYFSSHIAYMFLKDYESAIKILRLGLEANPCDTTIINNLAYVYALNDDYLSADVLMKQSCMNSVTSQDSIICHTATRGLIEFRKGNIELGNKLYTKAIIDAKDIAKDRILAYKAILNYLRELLLARKISVTEAHDIIDKVTLEDNQEIEQLKRDVVSEINRNSMGPLPIPTSKMNLDWL